MALPEFSMRQLLEAGVHFGHRTHLWNPKMAPYIFGDRSHIHIIDLSQTVPLLHQALVKARETAAGGGRILFVGTKRAASDLVRESASRCAQYYVNHRWLGGMLTNWSTIFNSIFRLRELEVLLSEESETGLTKKELLKLTREKEKLNRALGGIKDMGKIPDLMFVIDTNKEAIAIKEARKLGIPVIAILDTNCDPTSADFPIPGNDDAVRAIALYCEFMADAVLDGMTEGEVGARVDTGAVKNLVETTAAEPVVPEEQPAKQEKVEVGAEPAVVKKPEQKPAKAEAGQEPAKKTADTREEKSAKPIKPDDISLIDGIGPTYRKKLESAGITTYAQIARLRKSDIKKLDEELDLKGKIVSGKWVEQAGERMAGKLLRAKGDEKNSARIK